MKYKLLICFIVISIAIVALSYNYNKKKLLPKNKYEYHTTSDLSDIFKNQKNLNSKDIVYILLLKNNTAEIKEYNLNDKNSIIEVPKGEQFIISFNENSTILYAWNLQTKIDANILSLNQKFKTYIPIKNENRDGESYTRKNFIFNSLNKGIQKFIFKYEPIESPNSVLNKKEFIVEINII